ncbi:hypothetical protein [Actinomadura sp. 3N508]|uniref:hypothetical protein n=1 Tax=Actinomadura sp. 3N508 TaxID=3375153 RepID=UPI00379897EC
MALIAGTGVASLMLLSHSLNVGLDVWHDAQSDPQFLAAWRGAAVSGYTSGSGVGHICALLAGLLVAHAGAAAGRGKRIGAAVAVFAGTVLALVNLSLAWWKASPRLTRLDAVSMDAIDPGLRHHPSVIIAIVLVFAAYLVLAAIGYGLGVLRSVKAVVAALGILVIVALPGSLLLAMALVPRPEV